MRGRVSTLDILLIEKTGKVTGEETYPARFLAAADTENTEDAFVPGPLPLAPYLLPPYLKSKVFSSVVASFISIVEAFLFDHRAFLECARILLFMEAGCRARSTKTP